MPERNCDMCDRLYTYERANSKYCGERCRYNANNAVNGRVRVPDNLRFSILYRDGFACRFCGVRPPHSELQLDHVVPLAQGGKPLAEDNLVTTCARCNNGHGDEHAALPDALIGVYWNLEDFPPDEWIEAEGFRIVQGDDGWYDIEVK